ncbi:ricin-type beta-trefoil lectin domain protein [Streptosporangium oxazolinicum]|uniref:Ricin-type beta-trefoil lectin domain protein n=1 Tax=Streptosporangium oxazolinicum TaxID=909287 RepID=A0ABP8AQ11_9ACTN
MTAPRSRHAPRHRIRALAVLTGLATALASFTSLPNTAAYAQIAPTVSSWVTTPDRSQLLSPGPSATFETGGNRPSDTIIINTGQRLQTMDGFGGSLTDSSAELLYDLPAAQRDEVMRSLFSPTEGIGMSFLRQPIGGSDFIDEPHYTYNDLPNGQTDLPQARFSIAHDQSQILPLLRRALQLNPALKVMATPWGQPAWMKANNSVIGGRIKNDPAYFRSYALYLLKFVQAYEAEGVPIHSISVQNEPQNRTPDAYAGTDMPVAHQVAIINELGPMLRDAGLSRVKIISYDHNWAQHPDDAADAARMGVPAEPNYPYDILNSSAAQWVAGTGYHCYAGDPSAQTNLHNAFPAKDTWFTECSGWHGAGDDYNRFFSDTLKWHARNISIGTTRNWAKGITTWNLALNSQGGPVNGGCGNNPAGMCTGVVSIDGTTVRRNAEYYTLGHLSRFVKDGAVRLNSNNAGDLHNTAFVNPNGSTALVVTNISGDQRTFGVEWNGRLLSYTIPGGAIATLTWPADGGPVDNQAPTVPTGLNATGTTATSTTLTWTASTDNVGVSGYQIFRGATQVGTSATTSFTDSGLTPSTTYSYTVRARDAAGNVSGASAARSVTTSATGTAPIDPATWYQVVNANSGKCVDGRDLGTGNGTALQQWTCNSPAADNQDFRFQPAGDGFYRVVYRRAPALAWDVTGGGGATGDGAKVNLWTYGGGTNQQWKPTPRADGGFTFTARHSGKCLDVTDMSTGNGALLQQWSCHNSPAQTFRLQPRS